MRELAETVLHQGQKNKLHIALPKPRAPASHPGAKTQL